MAVANTVLVIFIIFLSIESSTFKYTVKINTLNVTNQISSPFYGFTLDFWNNEDSHGKWNPNAGALTLNFSNENLIALTKKLTPAILRIGGSPEDSVVYDIDGECSSKYGVPDYPCSQTSNTYPYYGCINKTRWNQINQFAIKTGVTLIFGLNACYGRQSDTTSMNFSNIINLINYTNSMGDVAKNLYGFEFGNEIEGEDPPKGINATIYGKDFYELYKITGKGKYKLFGADGASPNHATEFMTALNKSAAVDKLQTKDVLHRLTYHHYAQCEYPNGTVVFSLECLSDIIRFANVFNEAVNPFDVLPWMGEGAEHTGGGTPNVSNTFVDNFYYIYQLCTVIKYNINASLRSDLTGGDYELIDHHTFEPNPDYWILYIWKQLIGDAMFDTDLTSATNANDRSAAFSFRATVSGGDAITLVLINFDMNNMVEFDIDIIGEDSDPYLSDEYYLKPYGSSLQTQLMYVNDVLMEYKDNQFPILKSVQGNGQNVTLDPARIAFVVLTPQ